jgi:L-seryl-tRNA(Ser) seleniumtransferase
MKVAMNDLQQLPSVDQLLNSKLIRPLIRQFGRQLVVNTSRNVMESIRFDHSTGKSIPSSTQIIQLVEKKISFLYKPSLIPVINATGVILHTNLGRAPLSDDAIQAMIETSRRYSNLEIGRASCRERVYENV